MVKVKAGVLFNSQEALSELSALPLPTRTAYHVARAIRKFQDEFRVFDEKRIALVVKHSEKAADGQTHQVVSPDKMAEFVKEFNDMSGLEIEVSDVNPLSIADLGDSAKLKPSTLMQLDWFIKE